MTTSLLRHLDDATARILNATISEEAGRWFCSLCVEIEREVTTAAFPEAVDGVDLGVKSLAVLSTGEVVPNQRALNRYARKMARLQRELSRRERGSKHRAETKRRLARVHRAVRTCRGDALDQLSSRLASTYGTVVLGRPFETETEATNEMAAGPRQDSIAPSSTSLQVSSAGRSPTSSPGQTAD